MRVGHQLESQVTEFEARLFGEAEVAYGRVEGVPAEGFQGDIGPHVVQVQVGRVELPRGLLCRQLVVGYAAVADEDGIYAQVEVRLGRRRVVRREGVEEKLVVGGGEGIAA